MTRKLKIFLLMSILLMTARAGGLKKRNQNCWSCENTSETGMEHKKYYPEKILKSEQNFKEHSKRENIETRRKTNTEEIKTPKPTILPKEAQEFVAKYSLKRDAQKFLHVMNRNEDEKEHMMRKREEHIMKYLVINDNHNVEVNEHSELLIKDLYQYHTQPYIPYPHRLFPVAVEYKQEVYIWWSIENWSIPPGSFNFVYRKFPFSEESISFTLDARHVGFSLNIKGTQIENVSGNSDVIFRLEDANKQLLSLSKIARGWKTEPFIKFVERNVIWIDVEEITKKVMNYKKRDKNV